MSSCKTYYIGEEHSLGGYYELNVAKMVEEQSFVEFILSTQMFCQVRFL